MLLGTTETLLSINMENFSQWTCKALRFLDKFLFFITFSLVVGFFIDKVLFLKYPGWHYNQNWSSIIPKCSILCIATINILSCSPSIAACGIRNNSCEIVSKSVWISMNVFMSFLLSGFIAASNTVFVFQLRNYRLEQRNDKARPEVTFGVSKEAKEEDSNGNEKVSINSARNESRHGTETFQFSAEDMKAVKFMIFWSIALLLLSILSVIVFFAVKLVNEEFGVDIDFWAGFGLYEEYVLGLQNILSFLSRESSRKSLMERYSVFIRKR